MAFCVKCGSKFADGEIFCGNCGTPKVVAASPAPAAQPVCQTKSAAPAAPVKKKKKKVLLPIIIIAVIVALGTAAAILVPSMLKAPYIGAWSINGRSNIAWGFTEDGRVYGKFNDTDPRYYEERPDNILQIYVEEDGVKKPTKIAYKYEVKDEALVLINGMCELDGSDFRIASIYTLSRIEPDNSTAISGVWGAKDSSEAVIITSDSIYGLREAYKYTLDKDQITIIYDEEYIIYGSINPDGTMIWYEDEDETGSEDIVFEKLF